MGDLFASAGPGVVEQFAWGRIRWLVSDSLDPGATMTVGICEIRPGHSNPLHRHPNCDEVLVVINGRCEKRVGNSVSELGAGDSVRIPRGVEHQATTVGREPMICVITYDTPQREIEFL